MKLASLSILSLVLLASCQSSNVTKQTGGSLASKPLSIVQPLTEFKFSFHISGSGINYKPMDGWTMDTNGMMAVHTSRKVAIDKFDNVNALAALDPPDFDTLKQLVMKGKLYEIDSTDLTEQCPEGEMYHMDLVPLEGHRPVRLAFFECAGDYNLLLQPQRKYFRLFLDWWERMRVKYRPATPE